MATWKNVTAVAAVVAGATSNCPAQSSPDFDLPIRISGNKAADRSQINLITQSGGISSDNSDGKYSDSYHTPDKAYYSIDVTSASKTGSVVAAGGGTILKIDRNPPSGFPYVIVNHGNGYYTKYQEFNIAPTLTEGVKVATGDSLGTLGWKNHALHFQVEYAASNAAAVQTGHSTQTTTQLQKVTLDGIPINGYKLDRDSRGNPIRTSLSIAQTKYYGTGSFNSPGMAAPAITPSAAVTGPSTAVSPHAPPPAYNQNETVNSDGLQTALQPAYRNGGGVATSGPGVAGLMMASKLDFHIGTSNDFSSYNLPSAGLSGSRGSATLNDAGSNASAGDMYWGRWAGPGSTMTSGSGTVTGQSLHYIYGVPVTNMPTSGIVTYNPAGGTRPSNSAGNAGTFNGGTVQVNFATRGVNIQNLNFSSAAGSTFNLNGTATYNSNALFKSTLSGTCAGGTCAGGAATGSAVGAFTGVQAAGLGLSYAGANSGTGAIVGVQAFKR